MKDKIENYTEDAWSERTSSLTDIYKEYMVFFHQKKSDPIHQKVQNTMKRLRDEDEMDWDEALDFAVKKRRFLFEQLAKE